MAFIFLFILTILLVVANANLDKTKLFEKVGKCLKPWYIGAHLIVLGKSFPIDTNMTGFRYLSILFAALLIPLKLLLMLRFFLAMYVCMFVCMFIDCNLVVTKSYSIRRMDKYIKYNKYEFCRSRRRSVPD